MLEEVVKCYAAYFKLDFSSDFQTLQNVIDNMLTRLEELTCVLQMIKLKNNDCSMAASEDISKYRNEITMLSRKIMIINEVILKLQNNVDMLEKQVERAEFDFGVHNDNRIKSFLKPLLLRSKEAIPKSQVISTPKIIPFESVMDNFENMS